MYTLAVVILTLVIAWATFYGVLRLAIYAAKHESDEFRGCGLTSSLRDRMPGTVIKPEGGAAARRSAAGAIVVVRGQR